MVLKHTLKFCQSNLERKIPDCATSRLLTFIDYIAINLQLEKRSVVAICEHL